MAPIFSLLLSWSHSGAWFVSGLFSKLCNIGLHNAITVALLACVLWALMRTRTSPLLLHLLCVLLLVKLLIPPLVSVGIGNALMPVTSSEQVIATTPVNDNSPTAASLSLEDSNGSLSPVAHAPVIDAASSPHTDSPRSPSPQAPRRTMAAIWSSTLPALVWIWVAGIALSAVIVAIRLVRFRRLLAGTLPASRRVAAISDDLAQQMGLSLRPDIRVAHSAQAPFVCRLGRRPTVILPLTMAHALDERELAMVLAHELAHLRRRDHWVRIVELVVAVLYWWNPLVWVVRRWLHALEERCCDAWVAWLFPDRVHDYARCLLKAADLVPASSPLPVLASPFLHRATLHERIQMLLEQPCPRIASRRAILWLALLTAVIVPLGIGSRAVGKSPAEIITADEDTQSSAAELPAVAQPATASDTQQSPLIVAQAEQQDPTESGGTANSKDTLSLTVTLEGNIDQPITVTLFSLYDTQSKAWSDLAPGDIRLDVPALEAGRYRLAIASTGFATRSVMFTVGKQGIELPLVRLELYRPRYLVLRYVANMRGQRELTGPNTKEGRVAISQGSLADLHGDWLVYQSENKPVFSMHRVQAGNGFYLAPQDASFDELTLAPEPDQYSVRPIELQKGQILLTRIIGDGPRWRRYAKLLIEDITETPPEGVLVVDEEHPTKKFTVTPDALPPKVDTERSSGKLLVTIDENDGDNKPTQIATVQITLSDTLGNLLHTWDTFQPGEGHLSLPGLEHDVYRLVVTAPGYAPVPREVKVTATGLEPTELQIKPTRTRYVVLQYAINTKGERALTGPNIKQGRVAIESGSIPALEDWSVSQNTDSQNAGAQNEDAQNPVTPKVVIHRRAEGSGFIAAPEGARFEDLAEAPAPEEYKLDEFEFHKGQVLFNRVVSYRPDKMRYAKLLVEDVTETLPEGIQLIRRK